MSLPSNPFAEVLDALWRKIDDQAGGAALLHAWANTHNPGVGLTSFRVDDTEGGGYPAGINSTESPALHIGNAPSQQYGWAVTRTLDLPEQYQITGVVASRDQRDREEFLWLVLRALWYDYPRLLDSGSTALTYIKRWQVMQAVRSVQVIDGSDTPFWKFRIDVQVHMCFDLTNIMVSA